MDRIAATNNAVVRGRTLTETDDAEKVPFLIKRDRKDATGYNYLSLLCIPNGCSFKWKYFQVNLIYCDG